MKIVIATTTSYSLQDESSYIRSELAIELITKAKNLGYEIVVVDNHSSEGFLQQLKNNNINYLEQLGSSMGEGKRDAIRESIRLADVVCLTEPEKVSLLDSIQIITEPIINRKADMVIPKRKSLSTYPHFQQSTEIKLNSVWKKVTAIELDISFGPRIFSREMANYFLNYQSKYGDRWESIFLPVIDAVKDRKKIVSVEINYNHPQTQTQNEEGNKAFELKRLDQLQTLSHAIHTYWNR